MVISKSKMENLPLEWVRVFEAAGRNGSFTAAAQECGLTQAAVSQRIRNLEERIGASLFSRQARGVTLTVDGEAWLPYVSNALQTLNRSAEELFEKPLKKLVLSASASVTQLWIIPRLARLQAQTDYQISLTTMTIEADFAKANATLEIRYGTGYWPDLRSTRLYAETLTPLVAPSLLQDGANWQDLPRIAVSGPRPGWQEWAAQFGDPPTPAPKYRFDNLVSALAAARAGLGVVLGSLPLVEADLADKSLVRLSENTLAQEAGYWMIANERLADRQWENFTSYLCK